MNKLTLLFAVLFFGLTGCSSSPGNNLAGREDKPDDFSISLDWSTGLMPEPRMNYSYRIQINPSGEGSLQYHSGDRSVGLEESFIVSEENLNLLYQLCYDHGAFKTNREKGEPLDGGPVLSLYIFSKGKRYTYLDVSELSENERNTVYTIAEQVQKLVPDDLWSKMNQLQLDYESASD